MIYNYRVLKIEKVHDGDSFKAIIDLGFNIQHRVDVRLAGLDAPEISGVSRDAGILVRDWLEKQLYDKQLWIDSKELDKYGRTLAKVYIISNPDIEINKLMVDLKLALPYIGGNRSGTWTNKLLTEVIDKLSPK